MTPSESSQAWSVVLDDASDLCNDDYILQWQQLTCRSSSISKSAKLQGLRPYDALELRPVQFTSILLVILQSLQSVSMLNLSTYHDIKDCDARPIAPGTCVMFPGHSSGDWSWTVNMLSVGGILGSLLRGQVADRLERTTAFVFNAMIIATGSTMQALAPTISIFTVGRFISGIAAGATTGLPRGYINEDRATTSANKLGLITNTAAGWRCLAALFPVVLAGLFLFMCRHVMVTSPTRLLTQGRHDEAKIEIGRLDGPNSVSLAMSSS